MKYLICSDTHGRIISTKKLLDAIKRENPDFVIHLGDFLYNGPRNGVPDDYDPASVADIFSKLKDKIIGIKGNCDSRVDETVLGFALEDSKALPIGGHIVWLVHGDKLDEVKHLVGDKDIILYGHTHIYEIAKLDGVLYVNPGSIGFPKNDNPSTYAILEDGMISIKELESGKTLIFKEI